MHHMLSCFWLFWLSHALLIGSTVTHTPLHINSRTLIQSFISEHIVTDIHGGAAVRTQHTECTATNGGVWTLSHSRKGLNPLGDKTVGGMKELSVSVTLFQYL